MLGSQPQQGSSTATGTTTTTMQIPMLIMYVPVEVPVQAPVQPPVQPPAQAPSGHKAKKSRTMKEAIKTIKEIKARYAETLPPLPSELPTQEQFVMLQQMLESDILDAPLPGLDPVKPHTTAVESAESRKRLREEEVDEEEATKDKEGAAEVREVIEEVREEGKEGGEEEKDEDEGEDDDVVSIDELEFEQADTLSSQLDTTATTFSSQLDITAITVANVNPVPYTNPILLNHLKTIRNTYTSICRSPIERYRNCGCPCSVGRYMYGVGAKCRRCNWTAYEARIARLLQKTKEFKLFENFAELEEFMGTWPQCDMLGGIADTLRHRNTFIAYQFNTLVAVANYAARLMAIISKDNHCELDAIPHLNLARFICILPPELPDDEEEFRNAIDPGYDLPSINTSSSSYNLAVSLIVAFFTGRYVTSRSYSKCKSFATTYKEAIGTPRYWNVIQIVSDFHERKRAVKV